MKRNCCFICDSCKSRTTLYVDVDAYKNASIIIICNVCGKNMRRDFKAEKTTFVMKGSKIK